MDVPDVPDPDDTPPIDPDDSSAASRAFPMMVLKDAPNRVQGLVPEAIAFLEHRGGDPLDWSAHRAAVFRPKGDSDVPVNTTWSLDAGCHEATAQPTTQQGVGDPYYVCSADGSWAAGSTAIVRIFKGASAVYDASVPIDADAVNATPLFPQFILVDDEREIHGLAGEPVAWVQHRGGVALDWSSYDVEVRRDVEAPTGPATVTLWSDEAECLPPRTTAQPAGSMTAGDKRFICASDGGWSSGNGLHLAVIRVATAEIVWENLIVVI